MPEIKSTSSAMGELGVREALFPQNWTKPASYHGGLFSYQWQKKSENPDSHLPSLPTLPIIWLDAHVVITVFWWPYRKQTIFPLTRTWLIAKQSMTKKTTQGRLQKRLCQFPRRNTPPPLAFGFAAWQGSYREFNHALT